jgi:hypothetical protein
MLDSWDIAEKDESNDAGVSPVAPDAAADPLGASDADPLGAAEDAAALGDSDAAVVGAAEVAAAVGATDGDGVDAVVHAAVSTMMAPATAATLRMSMWETPPI